eukprot:CAMPEP_0172551786 /NCGR_PEP_ID=MMETSP1067-20121228/41019_1 /TAXON_ID=265564 ORGANISM="Thalassiosira punctigera, Strain Tpunct2005C2" /NCGR_SAMPLE_ID=MMETSP1067 /ASSEMBLY_ACC=CAM_ASM_000444 /LENGTH=181 /DNA_ID=CAMNT_0013339621 /DNA_START=485 /DNA_END=1030 /DNA_ORIENTATION=+
MLERAVTVWGVMHPTEAAEGLARLGYDVLLVHMRSGDLGRIGEYFSSCIKAASKSFRKIVVISGVHSDTRYSSKNESWANLLSDVDSLKLSVSLEFYPHNDPDTHLYMMQNAKHLLVHRGGFSAIGALINRGTVYLSQTFLSFNISLFENMSQKEESVLNNTDFMDLGLRVMKEKEERAVD